MSTSNVYKNPSFFHTSPQTRFIRRRGRGIFKYSFSTVSSSPINLIPIHGFDTPNAINTSGPTSRTSPQQIHIESANASPSKSRRAHEQKEEFDNTLGNPVCNGNIWVALEEEMEKFKQEVEKGGRSKATNELRQGIENVPTVESIALYKRSIAQWRAEFDDRSKPFEPQ
jgi:hypothetical protein